MDEKLDKIVDIVSKQLEFKNAESSKVLREAIESIQEFDSWHKDGYEDADEFGSVAPAIKVSESFKVIKSMYLSKNDTLPLEEIDERWIKVIVYALIGKIIVDGNWKK